MNRLRLYDVRLSDFPQCVGLCQSDVTGVASAVNTVQRRLLYAKESGDEGWFATWAEIAFNVYVSSPYITLPREVARLEGLTVCTYPVAIRNQFYSYLRFGSGRMPKACGGINRCNSVSTAFERNNVPSVVDLTPGVAQYIRIYPGGSDDLTSRVLIQGADATSNTIYSADGSNNITGQFVTLEQPFVQFPYQLTRLDGIQKDVTKAPIQVFKVDPTTGVETLMVAMQPTEQTAWYRRLYLNQLPPSCCPTNTVDPNAQVQVVGMAKLNFIPVVTDTDYCLLQNLEAMIEEAQAMRYSRIDTLQSKQMAQEKHAQAIRLLNGELIHYEGKNNISVEFAPFGSARLARAGIGTLI